MTASGSSVPDNRGSLPPSYPWKTTLLCLAAFAPGVMAQSILAPPPATPPLVPSSIEEYQTNQPVQMRVFSSVAPASSAENEPFKLGPITLRPDIFYQFIYGNGIESSPGQAQDTIVQELDTGLTLDLGPHWTLNYTPAFMFYSSSAFRNTINQSAQLQWGTVWHEWFLTGSQSYRDTDDPEIQTAGQTEQQNYSTALNAVYQVNDKLSMTMGLNQTFNDYGQTTSTNLFVGLVNSRSWSTMDWLNDQFWPRLSAGVGLGLGYNQQQESPDSTFQLYQAQINWRVTDKISFQSSGGLEDEEYLSGGERASLVPIFSAGLQYQPFEQTRISVSASRTLSTAAYLNENLQSTSISGSFSQRLLAGLVLELTGGFSSDSYIATAIAARANSMNDDVYSFNARLSCPFPKRGTFSIFYQYSDTSSVQSGFAFGSSAFSFSSNQIGFDVSYAY